MDFDDFKKRQDEIHRSNFNQFKESFDRTMKSQGVDKTFDEVMGGAKPPPPASEDRARQAREAISELMRDTTDDNFNDVMIRALMVYRSVVRHAKNGGTVRFVNPDGTDKTLKVRLKPEGER